jgi:hypothetical protein
MNPNMPTKEYTLLTPTNIKNGNIGILDTSANQPNTKTKSEKTHAPDLISVMKTIIKEIETSKKNPVPIKNFPEAYHLYYQDLKSKLEDLQEKFDAQDKILTKYKINQTVKNATSKFNEFQPYSERLNSNQRHQAKTILQVLLLIIETINSTPSTDNFSKSSVNRKSSGIEDHEFKTVKRKKTKDKAHYQKQRNNKINFFQQHGGVIITQLFIIAVRKINIEWRNEHQTRDETLDYFLQHLIQKRAKEVTESFIKEEKKANESFRFYQKNYVSKTSNTIRSDFYFMVRQVFKRINPETKTHGKKTLPQPM